MEDEQCFDARSRACSLDANVLEMGFEAALPREGQS